MASWRIYHDQHGNGARPLPRPRCRRTFDCSRALISDAFYLRCNTYRFLPVSLSVHSVGLKWANTRTAGGVHGSISRGKMQYSAGIDRGRRPRGFPIFRLVIFSFLAAIALRFAEPMAVRGTPWNVWFTSRLLPWPLCGRCTLTLCVTPTIPRTHSRHIGHRVPLGLRTKTSLAHLSDAKGFRITFYTTSGHGFYSVTLSDTCFQVSFVPAPRSPAPTVLRCNGCGTCGAPLRHIAPASG